MTLTETEPLTPKEWALLTGVATKQPYEDIALSLGIDCASVGVAVMNALNKIGLGRAPYADRVRLLNQALEEQPRIAPTTPPLSAPLETPFRPRKRGARKKTAASLTASADIPSAQSVAERIPFLTARQREVLDVLAEDRPPEESARKLGLRVTSLWSYFSSLTRALEINDVQKELCIALMKEARQLHRATRTKFLNSQTDLAQLTTSLRDIDALLETLLEKGVTPSLQPEIESVRERLLSVVTKLCAP